MFGISDVSLIVTGGGSPCMLPSWAVDGAVTGGSIGASMVGADLGAFGGTGACLGFAKILAQLLLPSGLDGTFGSSGTWEVESAETCSHPESSGDVLASAGAESSHVPEGAETPQPSSVVEAVPLTLLDEGGALPPFPARLAPRLRSEAPRPRAVPRATSEPPRPRPPLVEGASISAPAGAESLAFDWERSLVFFLTSPHCDTLPIIVNYSYLRRLPKVASTF